MFRSSVLGVRAYSLQRKTNRDIEGQAPRDSEPDESAEAIATRPGTTRGPEEQQSETEDELVLVAGPNAYGYAFDSVNTLITYIYNIFDYLRSLARTF